VTENSTDPAALKAKAKTLGVELEESAAALLLGYLDAMLTVNEHINLTGVRDREQAVVLHALDSLAFGLTESRPAHALDLGTGNGFPGVAVALLHPRTSVVLLDRTAKKIRAIGTCLLTARIQGVETVTLDAAQAPGLHREMRAAFDLVTARAVGSPAEMAALARPLLAQKGQLVLWLDAVTEAPESLDGFRREREIGYDLPEPAARHRRLVVYRRG
jgi:16S rRNA (guanine527-N7)-methyltransferase